MKAAKTDNEKRNQPTINSRLSRLSDRKWLSLQLVLMALIVGFLFFLICFPKVLFAQYIVPGNDILAENLGVYATYHTLTPSGGGQKAAQPFYLEKTGAVCAVDLYIRRSGTIEQMGDAKLLFSIRRGQVTNTNIMKPYPYPLGMDYLPDRTQDFTTSTTFIFDPCLTLDANVIYWMRLETTGLPANRYIDIPLIEDVEGEPGFRITDSSGLWSSEYSGGIYGMKVLAYGFENISGYDEPVSDDYGFSTGTATGEDFGLFGNMLRTLMQYLFLPSDSVRQTVEARRDELDQRVPFAYFAEVTDLLGSVTSTSASTTVITINAGVHGPIGLWDTSSTKNSATWNRVTEVGFPVLRVTVWLSFIFWLFYRLRGLTL